MSRNSNVLFNSKQTDAEPILRKAQYEISSITKHYLTLSYEIFCSEILMILRMAVPASKERSGLDVDEIKFQLFHRKIT